jgi:hypothetical protein
MMSYGRFKENTMPRIDKSMFKTQSGSFSVGSHRTAAEEKMEMVVFKTDADLFVQFAGEMYDAIETAYVSVAPNSTPMLFTKDEFVKYAFTAMCARVRRISNDHTLINGERFEIRCDHPWALPATMAAVINAVGRVSMDVPVVTVVPVWNHAYDEFVLPERTWHRVSQAIRAVARVEGMKLVLVDQLAKDPSGDEHLLSLIPVRDEMGRIVRVSHRTMPVDPAAAAVFLISGFDPDIYAGVSLALPAMLLPPYYVEAGEVQQNLWRLTDVA